MNSTFRPALVLMSGRTAGVAVGFLIPLVLVRLFDQTQFGTYKQVFLVYATLYGIAQVGMAESLFYFLPAAASRGGRFAANAIMALGLAGIVVMGILAWAGPALAQRMGNPDLAAPIVLMGIYLLFMLMTAALEIVLISRQRYLAAAATYSVSDVGRAALYLLPLLAWPRLDALLLGAITFALLRAAATLIVLVREFGTELRPDLALLRTQMAYAAPFALAVLLQILQSNVHNYAVFYRFDTASFAIYSVGCLQIPLIDLVFSSASNVMMVRMGRALSDGRLQEVRAIWEDVTRKLALVFFPLVCLLLVTSRDLIALLFTPAYMASVPIFMVWSGAILASAFQVDGVLRVFARTRFILVMHAVTLVLVLILIGPFMSAMGLVGAALVSVLGVLAARGLGLWRIRQLMEATAGTILPWRRLGGILLVSMLAAVPAWMVRTQAAAGALTTLALVAATYALAYAAMLLLFGLLSASEREALIAPLRRGLPAAPQPEETRAP